MKKGAVTNKKQFFCWVCDRSLAYLGNTTNLFYHLQGNHPEEHSEVAPKKAAEKCESTRQAVILCVFGTGNWALVTSVRRKKPGRQSSLYQQKKHSSS